MAQKKVDQNLQTETSSVIKPKPHKNWESEPVQKPHAGSEV